MAERARLINPEIEIREEVDFFTEKSADRLLESGFDVVIDAIDSVKHKCLLIAACRDGEIPMVVCGRSGWKNGCHFGESSRSRLCDERSPAQNGSEKAAGGIWFSTGNSKGELRVFPRFSARKMRDIRGRMDRFATRRNRGRD